MNNWPKIRIILVILILIFGTAFIIFAIFFNKGYLEINAQSPYNLLVIGQKSTFCSQNICTITLAPGKYDIQLSKDEHQNIKDQIIINRDQTTSKSYQFIKNTELFVFNTWNPKNLLSNQPSLARKLQNLSLSLTSSTWDLIENQLNLLALDYFEINNQGSWLILEQNNKSKAISLTQDATKSIDLKALINYYFAPNSSVIYFIADNPETSLPSLYRKDLNSQNSPEILVNFIQNIKNPLIKINSAQNKVAIIERVNNNSANLYLIDIQAKTRKLIAKDQLISNFMWIDSPNQTPTTITDLFATSENTQNSSPQNFIIEKINPETFQANLYLSRTDSFDQQTLLPINNNLSQITISSDQNILYAQKNSQASGDQGFTINKLNLNDLTISTLYSNFSLYLPQKLEYQNSSQTLFLLINQMIYSLAPFI